jgi:hypothetical protein
MDDELDAMKTIYAALEPLDPPARGRVLSWVSARYEIDASAANAMPGGGGTAEPADQPEPVYASVGDLIDAAQPNGGPQYALAVAYWLQEIAGRDGWGAQELNSILKNLGHGLTNVTKTLESLKKRKPALVMQLSKSGRTVQARKTYKLTAAGVREARNMLSRSSEVAA